ncbi:hypothetical protein SmJEL517_g02880 [Synchytrium microbalum]|uniref:Uncharacterized protein n=1 Tax=Synchytrium microbalum TaxID=1806994 RepID=A0A507CA95_9FUNG|nr:uncharacterized protein SmJEL517_g02880 [Synchytrium microbalum]TPX34463.1 hypothetical protein SmJEL517_g02880 [Synchytrium microbalum]
MYFTEPTVTTTTATVFEERAAKGYAEDDDDSDADDDEEDAASKWVRQQRNMIEYYDQKTTEHRILVTAISSDAPSGFKWIRCINCDTTVYGYQIGGVSILSDDLMPRTSEIYISQGNLLNADDIEAQKMALDYSPTFRIRLIQLNLQPAPIDVTAMPQSFQTAFESLQSNLLTYIHQKRLETDALIAEYTVSQNAKFEKESATARSERETLWSRICLVNQEALSQQPIPSVIPQSVNNTTTQQQQILDPLNSNSNRSSKTSPPNSFGTSVSSLTSTLSSDPLYGSLQADRTWPINPRKRASYVPPSLPPNVRIPILPNPPIVSNTSNVVPPGDNSSVPSSPVKALTPPPRRIKSALSLSSLTGQGMSSKNLRVTFADQPVELFSRKPLDLHKDTTGLFSLDGFEDHISSPIKPPLHNDESDSDAEDFTTSKSQSRPSELFGTSLPIDIASPGLQSLLASRPSMTNSSTSSTQTANGNVNNNSNTNNQQKRTINPMAHNEGSGIVQVDGMTLGIDAKTAQELLDDDTVFVAPHVLTASLKAESTFDRPSSFKQARLMTV